jgi:predicted hydrocarbon binding protein
VKEILEEKGGFFINFEAFQEMKKALRQTFASGAVVILASMAKACGKKTGRKIKGEAKGLEETLSKFSDMLNDWNWGEISFREVDFKSGTGKIIVQNSFESRGKEPAGQAGCHFLANYMAGFLSEIFEKDIAVNERKCVSKGDSRCEFEFARR